MTIVNTQDQLQGGGRITVAVNQRGNGLSTLGPVDTCLNLRYERVLNGAGRWRAEFPHDDYHTLGFNVKGAKFEFYIDDVPEFIGLLEKTTIHVNNRGERVIVCEGRDELAELDEVSVGFLQLGGSGAGVTDGPAQVIDAVNDISPQFWQISSTEGYTTTGSAVYAPFAGESGLSALVKLANQIGEHFRLSTVFGAQAVWLRDDTPVGECVAIQNAGEPVQAEDNPFICFIQNFEEITDGKELATRIYPFGAGQGQTRLTLAATNRAAPSGYTLDASANFLEVDSGEAEFGQVISRYVEFKDIRPLSNTNADLQAAANALFDAALVYLQRNDSASDAKTYKLSVLQLPAQLHVGDLLQVAYEDGLYSVNTSFVVLKIVALIDRDGNRTWELTVADTLRHLHGDADFLLGELRNGNVFRAHAQLNANSYTTGYRMYVGDNQTSGLAEMRFWFGDEVVQLQQVLWRFNLSEMVAPSQAATAQSTSSGASSTDSSGASSSTTTGASNTTTSGASNSTTTGASNSTTTDSGGADIITSEVENSLHRHDITFVDDTSGNAVTYGTGKFRASGGGQVETDLQGTNHNHEVTVEEHDHAMPHDHDMPHTHDIPHTHNMPHTHGIDHDHTFTPVLTTEFGVFRESGANTYTIAQLEYRINGSAWVPLTAATDLGGDWYQLDLTFAVYDAVTFRPNQENNLVEVRRTTAAGVDKSAMLDSFLSVRNIIQSFAYS